MKLQISKKDKSKQEKLCNASGPCSWLFGFAYQGEDIVFRFIIEYSSLSDLGL
jgi:hypothetical protein